MLTVEAPTDAQLAFIAALCRDNGYAHPDAVHSKTEASEIIGRLRAGIYRASDYAVNGTDDDCPVCGLNDDTGAHERWCDA